MKITKIFILLTLIINFKNIGNAASNTRNFVNTSNDIIAFTAPLIGTIYSLAIKNDKEGFKQFAYSYGGSMLTTTTLKEIVDKKRPDYQLGDKKNSFPSGHATSAFALAGFMHKRYGFSTSAPYYLMASYVGWARIYLDRHDIVDVTTGALIALSFNYFLVDKLSSTQGVAFYPHISNEYKGFTLTFNF